SRGRRVPAKSVAGFDVCPGRWPLPLKDAGSVRRRYFFLSSMTAAKTADVSGWINRILQEQAGSLAGDLVL
ncbi:MAG: hypothetical protein PHG65_11770, partial [Kiritimatiellae bacterium]|nr:hypothetical protein [Kiritimatiellia bacterium]